MTSTSLLHLDRPPVPAVRRVGTAFRTPVRGHAFAARPGGSQVAHGAQADLVREPDNPRDPLAVAVWIDARTPWRVGYLDRLVAARLAPRIDGGEPWTAVIAGWIDAPGGWRRPLVEVAVGRDGGVDPPARLWGRPPRAVRRVVAGSGQRYTA